MGKAIHEIADHYGLDPQLDQLTEECAELIQAVNKYRRTGDFTNLVEELADVEIMTAQVEYLLHAQYITTLLPRHRKRNTLLNFRTGSKQH